MDPFVLRAVLEILLALGGIGFTITVVVMAPAILRWPRYRNRDPRHKGGKRPQQQPRIIRLIFWSSVVILVLARLGILLIGPVPETIPPVVEEVDPRLTPDVVEELTLDTYQDNNDNDFIGPVVSESVLENGKTYSMTISGTWSAWGPGRWADVCKGIPEGRPETPSPEPRNGMVGIDVAYIFALPEGSEHCRTTGTLPTSSHGIYDLQISLDGGDSWDSLRPDDDTYNPEHRYTYTVEGEGHRAQIRYKSGSHKDDYGILTIQVRGPS